MSIEVTTTITTTVPDDNYHDSCMGVWSIMNRLQHMEVTNASSQKD